MEMFVKGILNYTITIDDDNDDEDDDHHHKSNAINVACFRTD